MRKLLGVALVVAVLVMPAVAKAEINYGDDFSGATISGIWWGAWTDGGGSFSQNGGPTGVLNFTSGGSDGGDGQYISNFNFDLNYDFYVGAKFNYNQLEIGGVGVGFYSADGGSGPSSIIGSVEAVYDINPDDTLDKYFYASIGRSDPTLLDPYNYSTISGEGGPRPSDSGWIGMHYDSASDILEVGAFNEEPSDTAVPIWESSFGAPGDDLKEGLKDLVGSGYVGFTLTGWSETGATLGTGEATLDNFGAMSTAPEPVSTILFLTGGAVLAVRRLRRKK